MVGYFRGFRGRAQAPLCPSASPREINPVNPVNPVEKILDINLRFGSIIESFSLAKMPVRRLSSLDILCRSRSQSRCTGVGADERERSRAARSCGQNDSMNRRFIGKGLAREVEV